MSTFAAVMTDQGVGAIATVQVFGEKAKSIIEKIFQPTSAKPAKFKVGNILLGTIGTGQETIDQVAIGCESRRSFAINCHGNPLIVADIMQLLQQNDAKLLTAEQLLTKILAEQASLNAIAIEAKLAQPKAKTIQGTKIIANQVKAGLSRKAAEWLQNINEVSIEEIKADTKSILKNSNVAKLLIYGCTLVIAGPPNSGKSTLLNCFAGKQKAIVTNIKGTTRDWISAVCGVGPLCVEFIDTAGLDEKLALKPKDSIEKDAQKKSVQLLEKADLVLLILDNSQAADQLDGRLLEKIAGKKVLTVLNKSDLPAEFDVSKLPKNLTDMVQISAKTGSGIENLIKKIQQLLGIDCLDLKAETCFTSRQENLLTKLINVKSKRQAIAIITELLNGRLDV
ncbi:MAG: GTPase [Planctomycetota bacterium]|jgi:tRNA modification GTPase